jgi:hypothetical protein
MYRTTTVKAQLQELANDWNARVETFRSQARNGDESNARLLQEFKGRIYGLKHVAEFVFGIELESEL